MILDDYKVRSRRRLAEAYEYISDERKTTSITMKEDTIEVGSVEDMPQLLGMLRNDPHLQKNLVTYHLATRDFVDELYDNIRILRTMGRVQGDGAEDVLAHVLVQSFPLGLDISDEEVRDCGMELVQALGKYPAVVCPHVTPVVDQDGTVRGVQKHNHILVSAFVHASCYDGGAKKFPNTSYEIYRLRDLNDKIAVAHGLPIIRDPGKGGKKDYYEAMHEVQGTSWKKELRDTIMRNRFMALDWTEFCAFMELDGYTVTDYSERGVQHKGDVYYCTPDGHTVWGDKLGDACKRVSIERYWRSFERVPRKVKEDEFLSDFVYSYDGSLFAKIPLGSPDRPNRDHALLKLGTDTKGDEWVWKSYFPRNEHVEIVNEDGETVKTVRGEEVVQSLIDLQYPEWMQYRAQRAVIAEEVRQKRYTHQKERLQAQLKKREEERNRWKAAMRTDRIERAAEQYMISHHADGTPRSLIGMILLFTLEMLGFTVDRGWPDWTRKLENFEPTKMVNRDSDGRLQRSINAVYVSERYSFLRMDDAYKYVDQARDNCRDLREDCRRIEVTMERQRLLVAAVSAIRSAEQIMRTAAKFEDQEARKHFLSVHAEDIDKFHEAKKLLADHNMGTEAHMVRIYQYHQSMQIQLQETRKQLAEEEEWLAALQLMARATFEAEEAMYQKKKAMLQFVDAAADGKKQEEKAPIGERIVNAAQRADGKPQEDIGKKKLREFGKFR